MNDSTVSRTPLASTSADLGAARSIRRTSHTATADPTTHYEVLEPLVGASRPPIVMIHGGAHTGLCYLETADGTPGWAFYFAARGHRVLIPDWPGCGLSSAVPNSTLDGARVCQGLAAVVRDAGAPAIVFTHSMSGAYGWKLIEQLGEAIAKLVAVAPAPPGNIQPRAQPLSVGPDFIEVVQPASRLKISRTQPFIISETYARRKLIGEGVYFPADQVARYLKTLQSIPARLLIERLNIEGSQLCVENYSAFRSKPILLVVGSHDIDHPVEVDRLIVNWLNEHAADAHFLALADEGIVGNGHMMMLESNGDVIAARIFEWLQ
jgi:pimeloyl-ACP methyl ester carboxylesterase